MEFLPLLDRSGRIREIVPKQDAYDRMIDEFDRTSDVTSFSIPQIALLLFRSTGELILVRRWAGWENPHLWDRTVVGHVSAEEDMRIGSALSPEACWRTAAREAREELGIELSLSPSKHALLQDYASGKLDTRTKAWAFAADTLPWYANLLRRKDGKVYMKRIFKTVYLGIYDGPIEFPDGEAEAVREVRLSELESEIARAPFVHTWDLPEYLHRYGLSWREFSQTLLHAQEA